MFKYNEDSISTFNNHSHLAVMPRLSNFSNLDNIHQFGMKQSSALK